MADQYSKKIILFASFLFLFSCKNDSKLTDTSFLTNQEVNLLQDGDLIMRRGKGFVSAFIIEQVNDSTNLSHIGIIEKSTDSLWVIHCLGNEFSTIEGVQICTLDSFLEDCYRDGLFVVRSNQLEGRAISTLAREYLLQRIPFDRKFDFSDSTAFSCLELPYRIFNRLHVFHEDMVCFKPFEDSSRFQVIIDKRNARSIKDREI